MVSTSEGENKQSPRKLDDGGSWLSLLSRETNVVQRQVAQWRCATQNQEGGRGFRAGFDCILGENGRVSHTHKTGASNTCGRRLTNLADLG